MIGFRTTENFLRGGGGVRENNSNPALLSEISQRRERNGHLFAPNDPSKPRELSQAQRIAIKHLAVGTTKATAARRAGVAVNTVANWFEWPEFRRALMAACEEVLAEDVPASLALLRKQVKDKKTNEFARQNAARDILDRAGFGRLQDVQATQIVIEVSGSMPELGQAVEVVEDVPGLPGDSPGNP